MTGNDLNQIISKEYASKAVSYSYFSALEYEQRVED